MIELMAPDRAVEGKPVNEKNRWAVAGVLEHQVDPVDCPALRAFP